MPTHLIRDVEGEQVGTITDTDDTFLIAQDDRPPLDIWTPTLDRAAVLQWIHGRGYTVEEAAP